MVSEVSGGFLYSGRDHREELEFLGKLRGDRLSGSIRGLVSTPGAGDSDYLGDWEGRVHPGGHVLYGTWRGWLADTGEQEPEDANSGQWGTVSAAALCSEEPHVSRVRLWLEQVWGAARPEDPWMLP
ncbi:MAG: hypothetical protein HY319_04315 [Armatimonadetes bacterium]|nr:hypothetical protein [Armatimonadota bacterium]